MSMPSAAQVPINEVITDYNWSVFNWGRVKFQHWPVQVLMFVLSVAVVTISGLFWWRADDNNLPGTHGNRSGCLSAIGRLCTRLLQGPLLMPLLYATLHPHAATFIPALNLVLLVFCCSCILLDAVVCQSYNTSAAGEVSWFYTPDCHSDAPCYGWEHVLYIGVSMAALATLYLLLVIPMRRAVNRDSWLIFGLPFLLPMVASVRLAMVLGGKVVYWYSNAAGLVLVACANAFLTACTLFALDSRRIEWRRMLLPGIVMALVELFVTAFALFALIT